MSRLRRAGLMSQPGREIGARWDHRPGGGLANDWRSGITRLAPCNLLTGGRLCGSRILSEWLPGGWPGMTRRGGSGLAGTCCRTRRGRDRHAGANAVGSGWLLRRQRLARAGKNLAGPGGR